MSFRTTTRHGRQHVADLCQCFGDSGLMASTHHDAADVERCDLCGMRCDPPAHPWIVWVYLGGGLALAAAAIVGTWLDRLDPGVALCALAGTVACIILATPHVFRQQ